MTKILIYTVHKAASMFLHKLSINVTREFNIPYYSINTEEYYDEIQQSSWRQFIEKQSGSGCFCPIRAGEAEPILPEDISGYSIILLLRDPRDVLTSLFFSHAYSHPRREGSFNPDDDVRTKWIEGGIDKYVSEKAPEYKNRYQMLTSNLLGKKNVVFIKYEDMVSDYSKWLEQFLSAFSHLPVPPGRIYRYIPVPNSLTKIHKKLSRKYDDEFTPGIEDMYRHKRQITPGDHKRKLKPDTIELLNDELGEILRVLNYEKLGIEGA